MSLGNDVEEKHGNEIRRLFFSYDAPAGALGKDGKKERWEEEGEEESVQVNPIEKETEELAAVFGRKRNKSQE